MQRGHRHSTDGRAESNLAELTQRRLLTSEMKRRRSGGRLAQGQVVCYGSVKPLHVCVCVLSCVQLFASTWAVAPLSVGFSRQGYWSVLLFPSPGDLPDPGIEHTSPALEGRFFTTEPSGKPMKPLGCIYIAYTIKKKKSCALPASL